MHMFDGQTLTKETAAFQLCDIIDPMLKAMVEDENGIRDVCDVSAALHLVIGADVHLAGKGRLVYHAHFRRDQENTST